MARALIVGAVVLGLAGASTAAAGGPEWKQFREAKGLSAATGRPIIVYSIVDEKGGGC